MNEVGNPNGSGLDITSGGCIACSFWFGIIGLVSSECYRHHHQPLSNATFSVTNAAFTLPLLLNDAYFALNSSAKYPLSVDNLLIRFAGAGVKIYGMSTVQTVRGGVAVGPVTYVFFAFLDIPVTPILSFFPSGLHVHVHITCCIPDLEPCKDRHLNGERGLS